jgi:ADP-ribose pyrophosphatase YjhB (NUDIX family)
VHPTDLTVGALVEQDGSFLIIEERVAGDLVLTQPGGHIENGESPEAAAVRETLEESACKVRTNELLGVYLWIHPQTRRQFLRIMFTADLLRQENARSLDQGVVGVHWYNAADIRQRAGRLRTPIVLRCVEDYVAGRRAGGDLLTDMLPLESNVPAVLASAMLV